MAPAPYTIAIVLVCSQVSFALWDICAREIFAMTKNPFNPLFFIIFRHLFAFMLNSCVAFGAHGRKYVEQRENHSSLRNQSAFLLLLAPRALSSSS